MGEYANEIRYTSYSIICVDLQYKQRVYDNDIYNVSNPRLPCAARRSALNSRPHRDKSHTTNTLHSPEHAAVADGRVERLIGRCDALQQPRKLGQTADGRQQIGIAGTDRLG